MVTTRIVARAVMVAVLALARIHLVHPMRVLRCRLVRLHRRIVLRASMHQPWCADENGEPESQKTREYAVQRPVTHVIPMYCLVLAHATKAETLTNA
jgi:hypothetical protein